MKPENLQKAIAGYMKDHPELTEKFNELDSMTGSLIRSLNSLESYSGDLESLEHYDDVKESVTDLMNDEKFKI